MAEEFVLKFRDKSASREKLFSESQFETIVEAIIKNSTHEISLSIWSYCFLLIHDDDLLYEIIKDVS